LQRKKNTHTGHGNRKEQSKQLVDKSHHCADQSPA
jgi:hypothetical protein